MRKFRILFALVLCICIAGAAFAVEAQDVYAKRGMVSSAHELASKAGVEILQKGGNAIDAAVATALALNVVEPNASGLGGGGFMVIRFAQTGEVVELDYREMAPNSATKDMYASEEAKAAGASKLGGTAVGVPGQVMGMWTALEKYGTMSWMDVAAPAIRLAEEGFELAEMQNGIITDNLDKLLAYNSPTQIVFLDADGLPVEAGTVLQQPELAEAFRLIGQEGPKAFYKGPIGKALVEAVNRTGGNMNMKDLENYTMEIREPVSGTYRGYEIFSTPPASSGGTHIVQLLNIMEYCPVGTWVHNGPEYLHYLGEAMKLVFADRQEYMADTAFVDLPLQGLTDKDYALRLFRKIQPYKVMNEVWPDDPWLYQPREEKTSYLGGTDDMHLSTSHFSVVDAQGNIVASTNTVNYFFGSGVIVPEYGLVLNNQMDDFSSDPASVNAPEPGKRPLSSMSPSIVLDPEGKPFMTIGAAGAWRIITAVSQIIMNVVDFGMTMDEAIEQPRIFTYASSGKAGPFLVEEPMSEETIEFLKMRGHNVEVRPRGGYFGTAQGILLQGSQMNGGADGRRLGVPVGY